MWQELDKLQSPQTTFQRLNVIGPPGTGKSMVAWAWTCYTAFGLPDTQRKSILWAHLNKGDSRIHLCHFVDGQIKTYQEGSKRFFEAIKNVDADLMVIDGITNKEYDSFSSGATSWMLDFPSKKCKVAVITSGGVVIPSEKLKRAQIKEWHMPSWTWENYVAACNNDKFYKQVIKYLPEYSSKHDRLASKFFMAGSSARWMFSFGMQDLEQEIKRQLRRVTNKEWILKDLSDDCCEGAVGHLRSEDKEKSVTFVSQYVMIEVSKTCELSFIKDAYRFLNTHNNPAFKGWVVEFDFLGQLHQALRHNTKVFVRKDNQEFQLPVTEIKYVDPDGDLNGFPLKNVKKHDGLWLIPIRWNQVHIP